jgi:hypothetical protein
MNLEASIDDELRPHVIHVAVFDSSVGVTVSSPVEKPTLEAALLPGIAATVAAMIDRRKD